MPHNDTKVQFLHFDSINSEYVQDFNNVSGVPNSYNSTYKMHTSFKNVERIFLTSLELPVGFTNCRKNFTDTLSFNLNGNNYNVVMEEKNFNSIAILVQDLDLACIGVVPNVSIIFSQSTASLRLTITLTGTVSSFYIIDTNFSKYMLGFRNKHDVLVSNVYSASYSNYNLNADNYIHVYMPNISGINASMSGGAKSTFKIPFDSVQSNIYFYQEGRSFEQYVDCRNSNFTLSNLTVLLYDRYGNLMNPRGYDYSFTLRIEYRD